MGRIQIISIGVSLLFLGYVFTQIKKGRLREEYAFIWILSTIALILFSFWRNGFEILAHAFGVIAPPNLIFTAAIFGILVYLLHLSLSASKMHAQNRTLAQDIALLKEKLDKLNQQ